MGNLHDSKTIKPLLEKMEQIGEAGPEEVIYDQMDEAGIQKKR